ncbi:MAG: hypothetical protein IIB54_10520 [Planctomycetes bacterium]|nr:hypothetical protein [Planctomycetota bacterium]
MDTEQITILVVGGTGAALALLALIIAVAGKLSAGSVQKDIEHLQQDISRQESAQWMKNRELEKWLKVRSAILLGMQKLKEEISRILHAKPGTLKKASCHKAVSDTGRAFSELCENHAGKLGEFEQTVVERAKDVAVEVTYQARAFLDEVQDPAELSSTGRETLLRLRAELTESQQFLSDRMMDRLMKHVLKDGGEGG